MAKHTPKTEEGEKAEKERNQVMRTRPMLILFNTSKSFFQTLATTPVEHYYRNYKG